MNTTWRRTDCSHQKQELKKPWNMKVTFIPIVNGALGTVTK